MRERMGDYSAKIREIGIRRILSHVSEAYGRMILYEGLFQVMRGVLHPLEGLLWTNGMHDDRALFKCVTGM